MAKLLKDSARELFKSQMKQGFRAVLSVTITKVIHQFIYQKEYYNQVIFADHFKVWWKVHKMTVPLLLEKNYLILTLKKPVNLKKYRTDEDVNTSKICSVNF